jgi:hypothetical protein
MSGIKKGILPQSTSLCQYPLSVQYPLIQGMYVKLVASQERFELPTDALEGRCSIQLSYWDISVFQGQYLLYSHSIQKSIHFMKCFSKKF